MAERGPAFGLSKEMQDKAAAKFDLDRAREAIDWMEAVMVERLTKSGAQLADCSEFQEILKDGQALCRFMNKLQPDAILKFNTSHFPFKEMENIEKFLRAAKKYGVDDSLMFQVPDLYESKHLYLVVNMLHALGSVAQKQGFAGPTIGVRLSDANKRTFTEEQLARGKGEISLQYGYNKGASQAGMTAPGTTRHM